VPYFFNYRIHNQIWIRNKNFRFGKKSSDPLRFGSATLVKNRFYQPVINYQSTRSDPEPNPIQAVKASDPDPKEQSGSSRIRIPNTADLTGLTDQTEWLDWTHWQTGQTIHARQPNLTGLTEWLDWLNDWTGWMTGLTEWLDWLNDWTDWMTGLTEW
jgi:hypothetical protein